MAAFRLTKYGPLMRSAPTSRSATGMPTAPISTATRALVVCACLLGAVVGADAQSNWGTWAEEVRKSHPLAGSAYVSANGTLIRPQAPNGRGLVLPRGLLLLGEVHDNPAHHRVRAWLIENSVRADPAWRPGVAFEQIDTDMQEAVDRFEKLDPGTRTAEQLFGLLKWQESGWPPADTYRPLVEAVVAAGLPIYPGSLPRVRVRSVARSGLLQIPSEERARLGLDRRLPEPLADALRRELEESHCGALPPQAMGGLAAAQRYRDAHMADVLLAAEQRHGSAILIAGNGHVRSDRGVPWHIRQRKPEVRVMSVLLVEVEDGKNEPAAYLPRDPDGKPAADLLIFTPRAERADPCESFRKKGSAPPASTVATLHNRPTRGV